MKNLRIIVLILFTSFYLHSNDSVYYASGNHLIPIIETDISVKKEVLSIVRIDNNNLEVTVDYEFYNPTKEKQLLVGFEAPQAYPSVDISDKNGQHPYISNFNVVVNGIETDHQTAMVSDSNYYVNNAIIEKPEEEIIAESLEMEAANFYYVYYFNAIFKNGINKIRHKYRFRLSESVMGPYHFDYILTAANRWANNGIDDFTLKIDMGEFQEYNIPKTFFDNIHDWEIDGSLCETKPNSDIRTHRPSMTVYVNEGPVVFKKKNFKPKGELNLYTLSDLNARKKTTFDHIKDDLPFMIGSEFHFKNSANEESFKVLRNLPYARRGFMFQTKIIQEYYESQPWYKSSPEYEVDLEEITSKELEWLEIIKQNEWVKN